MCCVDPICGVGWPLLHLPGQAEGRPAEGRSHDGDAGRAQPTAGQAPCVTPPQPVCAPVSVSNDQIAACLSGYWPSIPPPAVAAFSKRLTNMRDAPVRGVKRKQHNTRLFECTLCVHADVGSQHPEACGRVSRLMPLQHKILSKMLVTNMRPHIYHCSTQDCGDAADGGARHPEVGTQRGGSAWRRCNAPRRL